MNAHTPIDVRLGARTLRVDRVTLSRAQLAALCAQVAADQRRPGAAPWPAPGESPAAAGCALADRLIDLACRQAAGQVPPLTARELLGEEIRGPGVAEPCAPIARPPALEALTALDLGLFRQLADCGAEGWYQPVTEHAIAACRRLEAQGLAVRDEDARPEDVPWFRLSTQGRAAAEAAGL